MSEHIVHVSDASFDEEVLNSDVPVLVDFWAEWCGPCKMIAPVLSEIADEYVGKVKVCKVDVDANPDIPPKFGIRGIPTLILLNGGIPFLAFVIGIAVFTRFRLDSREHRRIREAIERRESPAQAGRP